jgi:hypothetical protein
MEPFARAAFHLLSETGPGTLWGGEPPVSPIR